MDAAAWDDLAEGRPAERWLGEHLVLLLRTGDGVAAVQGHCPHKFTPLAEGVVEGGRVTCPMHAACFDLATGEPAAGQAWAGRLQIYPVRVEAGRVLVGVQLTSQAGAG